MSRSSASSYPTSLFRTSGGSRQLRAQLLELPQLRRGEPGEHRPRDRAAVPAADPPLDGPPVGGERQADAAAVPRVGRAADEPPLGQPLHHAGQGRLAEQDVAIEFTEADRVRALGQRVEDVVLLHRQVLPPVLRAELPHQRGVRGQQRLPRVVGRVTGGTKGPLPGWDLSGGTGGRPPGWDLSGGTGGRPPGWEQPYVSHQNIDGYSALTSSAVSW